MSRLALTRPLLRSPRDSRLVAIVLAVLLATAITATASAQEGCGTAAGLFSIDGQFFSQTGLRDWAQGPGGEAVFAAPDGTALLLPALYERDAHWAGNAVDPTAFAGSGNKNNDDISAAEQPWSWGSGSGPQKNDLTDVYAHSAVVDDDIWLFLGAATRATNGSSHIDFEFNQQGFTRLGTTSGTIVGNGLDAGRTAGVDFIVSVDFEDGGATPVASFRKWEPMNGGFEFVPASPGPDDVFICTNTTEVPAPAWGAIAPNGDPATVVAPLQFVEIALNISALGIDPAVFCTDVSTLLFKTRSAASFTAELKDLALYQFSLVMPPDCTISADVNPLCEGGVATLSAPAAPEGADYTYVWSGPGGSYPDAPSIVTGVPGTYSLTIIDNLSGCTGEGCTLDLVVNPLPSCAIDADTDVICADGSARFSGPAAPAGRTYSYAWSGPGGPYADMRTITVTEAGEYSLVVTDVESGCVSSGSCTRVLTVNPLPPRGIQGDPLLCEGTTGLLCGPEGDWEWAWSGPGGPYDDARCIEVGAAGTYFLVVTDPATGCSSPADSFVVGMTTNPVCSIEGPDSICPGGEELLCGPEEAVSYAWYDAGENLLGEERCLAVTDSGTYVLRLEDANGCVSTCEHVVTLDETLQVTEPGDLWLCTGSEAEFCVTATGTGPITYQWYRDGFEIEGATDSCYVIPSITEADVATYSVAVAGKCGPVIERSADLRLADTRIVGFTDQYLCEGQDARLCVIVSGLGPWTYTWFRNGIRMEDETDSCLVLEAVTDEDEAEYTVQVAGACGPPVMASGTVLVGDCAMFCTLTQGYYGNRGGKFMGKTTLELLDDLITPESPLTVGVLGKRSLTFEDGSEQCIIDLLPGGSGPRMLPVGLGDAVIDPANCSSTPPFQNVEGRIRNILLSQTITLSLNTRLDPDLGSMEVCPVMIFVGADRGRDHEYGTDDDKPVNDDVRILEIDPAVFDALDALGLPHTVDGLLAMANRYLADDLGGVHVTGSMANVVGSINDLLDECAMRIHCAETADPQEPAGDSEVAEGRLGDDLEDQGPGKLLEDRVGVSLPFRMVAAPNPFRASTRIQFDLPEPSRVTLAVYDITGRKVTSLVTEDADRGSHTVTWNPIGEGHSSGVYFLRLEARGHETGDGFAKTQKVVVMR